MKFALPANRPRFGDGTPPNGARPAGPTVEYYNEDAVLGLVEYRAFDYNGRVYRIGPIPYTAGLRLHSLRAKLQQQRDPNWTPDTVQTYGEFVKEAVRVAGRLMIPCGWRRHVRWLLRNPLRNATESEVGAVLDFLWLLQTTPHVRLAIHRPPRFK